jgi:hypothetical protein
MLIGLFAMIPIKVVGRYVYKRDYYFTIDCFDLLSCVLHRATYTNNGYPVTLNQKQRPPWSSDTKCHRGLVQLYNHCRVRIGMRDDAGSNPRRGKAHIALLSVKGNLSPVDLLEESSTVEGGLGVHPFARHE